jgi:hypothetical protein
VLHRVVRGTGGGRSPKVARDGASKPSAAGETKPSATGKGGE